MFARNSRHLAAATLLCLLSLLSAPAGATITASGDAGQVLPWNDPASWGIYTFGYIGIDSGKSGIVTVAGGSSLTTATCLLGYNAGSFGTLIVTGLNSTWTSAGDVWLGYGGGTAEGFDATGVLIVENGAKVKMQYLYLRGNASSAIVTGAGSTLTNTMEVSVAKGCTLTISNGGQVISNDYDDYVAGTVIVAGATSTWTNNRGYLDIGFEGPTSYGPGTLTVANGGKVNSYFARIAGSGTAVVCGKGSIWNVAHKLGVFGGCSLTVGNGGKIMAESYSASTVNLHVSGNSMLVVGSPGVAGSTANSGKVNLYADAFMTTGTYSPITEYAGRSMTWSGTGSYNGYGGSWDNTAKTFTVAAAVTSDSAASNTLTTGERLLITDPGTGKRVGASFGTVAAGTNFSAAVLSGADLIGLPADQTVLGAWNFTTNFSGDQALLSFDIGAGQTGELSVWHYDGSTWTPFAAPDLTYGDDGIANFAVTGFSGYAVTAAVPEPCSLALLAMGGVALCRRRGRDSRAGGKGYCSPSGCMALGGIYPGRRCALAWATVCQPFRLKTQQRQQRQRQRQQQQRPPAVRGASTTTARAKATTSPASVGASRMRGPALWSAAAMTPLWLPAVGFLPLPRERAGVRVGRCLRLDAGRGRRTRGSKQRSRLVGLA